jgi:hypothetical protein
MLTLKREKDGHFDTLSLQGTKDELLAFSYRITQRVLSQPSRNIRLKLSGPGMPQRMEDDPDELDCSFEMDIILTEDL